MNVIGLEVSTSAAKCALYSAREGVIDSIEIPFQRDVTDKITQDPEGMVVALKALKSVAGRNQRTSRYWAGCTWHSLLLLDKDRRPLRPISMWADLSATPTVAALKQDQKFVQDCYQRTGCMVHAMYPAYKFYHLVRTNPELAQEVCYLSSQVEYLFQVLTGGQAVSRCTASGTGLLNIHTLDWDERLLDLVGLRRDQLSDLEEVFHHRGCRIHCPERWALKQAPQ